MLDYGAHWLWCYDAIYRYDVDGAIAMMLMVLSVQKMLWCYRYDADGATTTTK